MQPTRSSEIALAELGACLADAVAAALPGWVARTLRSRAPGVGDEVVAVVTAEVEADVLGDLRSLLARDVDDQRQSPLAVVRRAAGIAWGAAKAFVHRERHRG